MSTPAENKIGTARCVEDPVIGIRRHVLVKLAEPASEPWHIVWSDGDQQLSGWQGDDCMGEASEVGYLPVSECGFPEGSCVVTLPEPNVHHADESHGGPEYGWWPLDAHDVRAFLANGQGKIGVTGKPYVRVENSSGSIVFDASDAPALAAAILAAGSAADRLAAGSSPVQGVDRHG